MSVKLTKAMRYLSPATFKVLMAIARFTFGWQKAAEEISLHRLMEYTNLSNLGVLNSLKALEASAIVFVDRGNWKSGKKNYYKINLNWDGTIVNSVNNDTNSSVNSVHRDSVNSVHRETESLGELSSLYIKTKRYKDKTDNNTWPSPLMLIEFYNKETSDDYPSVEKVSEGRIRKARQYLKQFGEEAFWHQVFSEMNRSDFLKGRIKSSGHESFRANFDWLLTRGKDGTENAVKVFEGRYRDGIK